MGGELMQGNMLLNYVKESNDHGAFNSVSARAIRLCL